jgi:aminomethyltransferase
MADHTALHDRHLAAGAKMTEFGGWEMPLWYTSIVQEHLAVRSSVGLFDVSHMGKILITGMGANGFESLITRSISKHQPGKCVYAFLLNDLGKIIDDIILLKVSDACLFVVCNASTRSKVVSWIAERRAGYKIKDLTGEMCCIAVQGPKSAELIRRIADPAIISIGRYHGAFTTLRIEGRRSQIDAGLDWAAPIASAFGFAKDGIRSIVTRTGYTGEDGFEIFAPAEDAGAVWDSLLKIGADLGAVPAGLGARDTLRLEMCYLLSGHDFDGRQTPLEADSEFAVDWNNEFIGKPALEAQRGQRFSRLVAFESVDRGIPREGYALGSEQGEHLGAVTSGTLSPSLKKGVGMGYLPPDLASVGMKITYKVGTRNAEAKVAQKPFLKK